MKMISTPISPFTTSSIFSLAVLLVGCGPGNDSRKETEKDAAGGKASVESGYSTVNGLRLYYEIHGAGEPLVLLHGGGSTIQTSFGRILPALAQHRRIVAVELQAHGHSDDRNSPLSFEQDADDVASLLQNLKIEKADFLGFSNGGSTVLQMAIRHSQLVNKIVVCSAFYKRSGVNPQFWGFMKQATLENMPKELKEAYVKVAVNPADLQKLHDKCAARMVEFKDWSDESIRSILAPALLVIGDTDMVRPEHAVEMYRLIPNCQLAILPGGHGKYLGEVTTLDQSRQYDSFVPLLEEFLDATQ